MGEREELARQQKKNLLHNLRYILYTRSNHFGLFIPTHVCNKEICSPVCKKAVRQQTNEKNRQNRFECYVCDVLVVYEVRSRLQSHTLYTTQMKSRINKKWEKSAKRL